MTKQKQYTPLTNFQWDDILTNFDPKSFQHLLVYGGTSLGSSSAYPYRDPDRDVPRVLETIRAQQLDALVAIGGEGTLGAAERFGVPKVVHVSSSGIYGVPRSVPVGEDHVQQPLGRYGESKIEAERLCREALDRGLDVTALRPMTLFGPRMTGVFTILFEWVRLGKPVFLLGSGRNRVQGVSSWDVADACIAAVRGPRAKGHVALRGPRGRSKLTPDARVQHGSKGTRARRAARASSKAVVALLSRRKQH